MGRRGFCFQGAKENSDEAILAAALLKRLADVLFTVRGDASWLQWGTKPGNETLVQRIS